MEYQHLEDIIMMCPVCGGPMKAYPYYVDHSQWTWLTKAIVLFPEDASDDTSELSEIHAIIEGGPCFSLEDGRWIAALDGPSLRNRNPLLYIPLHEVCLKLAKKTVDIKGRTEGKEVEFRLVWQTLKKQYQSLIEKRNKDWILGPLTNLFNANKYNNINEHQAYDWDPDNEGTQDFLADPLDIPEMTESLVMHLRLYPSSESITEASDEVQNATIMRLETAMKDLHTSNGVSLECTRKLHSSEWFQILLESPIVPWLWDLDQEVLRSKEESKPADKEWDWELLVRLLSQPDIHVPGAVLDGIPVGLRNRQRIWRLVEDLLAEAIGGNVDGGS